MFIGAPGDIAADFPIVQDLCRDPVGQNPPLIESHDAVGVAADDFHVMLDEYDGRSVRRDRVDDVVHGREFFFRGYA